MSNTNIDRINEIEDIIHELENHISDLCDPNDPMYDSESLVIAEGINRQIKGYRKEIEDLKGE